MSIVECEVPNTSLLARDVVVAAYFRDSYRAPLGQPNASVVDIFIGIFGHHPVWMKQVLIARNHFASLSGLDVAMASEIMNPVAKRSYQVGDTIGPWPIFAISETELIAGRDNAHLDFRLSVLKEVSNGVPSVVISTICTVHNRYGKIYLFFIVPFHRWGVRWLMKRAIRAGRL